MSGTGQSAALTEARVLALSGGVGGAKLARGLSRTVPDWQLAVVCNTGDDFGHLGLEICPDLDSVTYALAGLADTGRGWGRADETWHALETLRALGADDWFALGDRDLGLHLWRTARLRSGATLSEIAVEAAARLGVTQHLLPMSDDMVRTRVVTDAGTLDFQDYFVRRRAHPRVLALRYAGSADARLPALLAAALASGWRPETIVICPSNPYLSIDPILSIPAWRDWLARVDCPIVAVSPIVGGQALKGCAAKMMLEFGLEVSAATIARHYGALLDGLVIDSADAALAERIERDGVAVRVLPTVMHDDADRDALARAVLDFACDLAAHAPQRRA
jgi:LPPG:FO 2-phospho-L-lactate transferase